jgi:son of sevenless-like protein
MLMTLRTNGIFDDKNSPYYTTNPSQIADTVGQYSDETPRQTSSPTASHHLPLSASPASSSGAYTAVQKARSSAAKRKSPPLMNGLLGNAPPTVMYVRALYDYEADDRTSLSFHEGDIIQVITQLESGWWDGVINGVRGWFPSNYCQVIASPEDVLEAKQNGTRVDLEEEDADEDEDEEADYESQYEEEEESERDDPSQLPMEGTNSERTRADFWIPQATPDGRLFYYNTETGESSMELPLESPSSATETGPRNRMNVNIPEKTRPPPEMMARGYLQDEDDESDPNSASEMEGESLMLASTNSFVSGAIADSPKHNSNSTTVTKATVTLRWDIPRYVFRFDKYVSHRAVTRRPLLKPESFHGHLYANHWTLHNLIHDPLTCICTCGYPASVLL